MRNKPFAVLLATAVAAVTAAATLSGPVTAAGAAPETKADVRATKFTDGAYIVQLAEQPVTAYSGGIAGLRATKPGPGEKIDPTDPAVVRYRSHLRSRQDAVLARVGGGKQLYSYGYAFNGFAAELTASQAAELTATSGVLAVTKDEARSLDTSSTPGFLGLSGPEGVWAETGATGENVIIGIVDGGVWPEHPSFSDRTGTNGNVKKDGKLAYQQISGWNGRCVPGEQFTAMSCNQKLIGARYYNAGWGGNAGIDAQLPWEYNSPRDYGGHGTHTASTAGGNQGVPATGPAEVLGSISGIAPRARLAAYKVCWETGTGGSCFTTDSVAAIDQAVADGVDVLNFSISGSQTNFRDPVEIAFLFAADAGVFVAASAGNSGPASSTVAHPGPWLTTVAAGTHNRDGAGSATLGDGTTYPGASLATLGPVGPVPLIDSTQAGLPGADPVQVALCYSSADGGNVLDPAKVAGKIVVCDRGATARPNKSLAVKEAGGVGMILLNTSINSVNADLHAVPSVHVQYSATDYAAIHAYATTPGATATIDQASLVSTAPAPFTAAFSSRGPLRASGSLLKPDLIAPGQDILAGVAPPGNGGKLFDLYSGTSMSSPHVAGLAAMFKQRYPSWSPMAIKSALMTTGYDVLDGGAPPAAETNPVLIFRQGAGHVAPASAMDPGLVFDAGFADWLSFICGVQPGGGCTGVTPMDASDLNVASIAVGAMPGAQTVTRRVTNVGASTATYTASARASGLSVDVNPTSLTLAPGETREFTVTLTRTTGALNTYSGGQLRWTDGTHVVRVPIVARPVAFAAPTEVNGSYDVTFGYTGEFSATPRGLVPAVVVTDSVADDPTDGACSPASPNAKLVPVSIPAATAYARFALFDEDVSPGADLDLCVFRGTTAVGSSGSGTSAEAVNLTDPASGDYTVVVQGWGVAGSSPFKLHTWLLGDADAGNMTVTAPPAAILGADGRIDLSFTGLAPATRYLGSVVYGGTSGLPSPTIVRVDTP